VVEGVRWLGRHRLLRSLSLISAATSFTQSMTVGVLVLYVLEVLRLPSGAFGLLVLGAGAGAVLGGALTPALTRVVGRGPMLTGGAVLAAVTEGAMGSVRNGFAAAGLFAASAAGVMVWNVLTMSLRQALIPQRMFGRVQGAYRTLVWGGIPLGSLAGGAVAHVFGIPAVFVASGAGLFVLAVVLGVLLHRHRGELTDEALAEEPGRAPV
jgi:MFS family permease